MIRKTAAFFLFFMEFISVFSQDGKIRFTGDIDEIKKRGEYFPPCSLKGNSPIHFNS